MNKFFTRIYQSNIAIALVIAIFFIGDRFLKLLAIKYQFAPAFPIIYNCLSFKFHPNHRIAFSLPLEGQILNILISGLILLIITYIIYLIGLNQKRKRTSVILLSLIAVGAISNFLDRLLNGFVIDYLELTNFTVFNLADAMISISALLLIIKNIYTPKST